MKIPKTTPQKTIPLQESNQYPTIFFCVAPASAVFLAQNLTSSCWNFFLVGSKTFACKCKIYRNFFQLFFRLLDDITKLQCCEIIIAMLMK
jgi:hypothetical protein